MCECVSGERGSVLVCAFLFRHAKHRRAVDDGEAEAELPASLEVPDSLDGSGE